MNKNIIIQKADKGNTTVVIDKNSYNKKMKAIIWDRSKFEKLDIQEEKHLNFIFDKEKDLGKLLNPCMKKKKVVLLKVNIWEFALQDQNQTFSMDKPKLIKQWRIIVHLFRPILSAIGTPTYDLAKLLVPILKHLTENEYTVHDSFSFTSEVSKINSKNSMASLDVDSLFTNISLEETIDKIINDLFLTTDKVHNFEREELKQLLTFAAYESFFIFNGEHYS